MAEVLIVGNGGREYELARSIGQSSDVERIFTDQENPGMAQLPKVEVSGWPATDFQPHVFTVIGPEGPLVDGLTNRIRAKGGLVYGPSGEAAQLEGSKAYATRFMQENNIPHPDSYIVHDLAEAEKIIRAQSPYHYVMKADGLAGGKGVILPKTEDEALKTAHGMLSGELFGEAGKTIVFQDRLHGPEVSAFVISDGKDFVLLPLVEDHKRLLEGDQGPNTGGMGAYAPVPEHIVSAKQYQQIHTIAEASIAGMRERGTPFQGTLFIGLMLAKEYGGDPQVIEYNVRFGDPETQVLLPLLTEAGVDIYRLLRSAAEGTLEKPSIDPRALGRAALTVCLAAEGYPADPQVGQVVHGLSHHYPGVILQHGSTRLSDDERFVATDGGRAMWVTGIGSEVAEAAMKAYGAIGRKNNGVWFYGMQPRPDIGHQAHTFRPA